MNPCPFLFSRPIATRLAIVALLFTTPACGGSGAGSPPAQKNPPSPTKAPIPVTHEPVSITDYGARTDGTDATAAIQAAIAAARQSSGKVYVPPGNYSCGPLKLEGVQMSGDGPQSVLTAPDPAHAQIALTGSHPGLSKLKLVTQGTKRKAGEDRVQVSGADSFCIDQVIVDGSNAGGIIVYGGNTGRITRNQVLNTKADSIHMTTSSYDIYVAGNYVRNSGDDCIAVVTYDVKNPHPYNCHNILIENNDLADQAWGRGITVDGGDHVTIRNNLIRKTAWAGILIDSENVYHTRGVSNIVVENNRLDSNPLLYVLRKHQALMILSQSNFGVSDIKIVNNQITNALNGPFRIDPKARNLYFAGNTCNSRPIQPPHVTGTGAGVTGATITSSILNGETIPLPPSGHLP